MTPRPLTAPQQVVLDSARCACLHRVRLTGATLRTGRALERLGYGHVTDFAKINAATSAGGRFYFYANRHAPDDDDRSCSLCSGTGEGVADGVRCTRCHGSGENDRDPDDYDGPDPFDDYDPRAKAVMWGGMDVPS
jgi:hypothetical protein